MALTIDPRIYFDQATLSDITIRSSTREFDCHKIILANRSQHFADQFKDGGEYAKKKILNFQSYWPEGVTAVVRHLYGFEYGTFGMVPARRHTLIHHLHVFQTATVFQLPELQIKAMQRLGMQLSDITRVAAAMEDSKKIFELVVALATHAQYDADFTEKSNVLLRYHLPALMQLKEFRAWLEEDNNPALNVMLSLVGSSKPVDH